MSNPKDPAFELPFDPILSEQTVQVGERAVPIHGAFATLGPWTQRIVLKVGDSDTAMIVPRGKIVSFHLVQGDVAEVKRPMG